MKVIYIDEEIVIIDGMEVNKKFYLDDEPHGDKYKVVVFEKSESERKETETMVEKMAEKLKSKLKPLKKNTLGNEGYVRNVSFSDHDAVNVVNTVFEYYMYGIVKFKGSEGMKWQEVDRWAFASVDLSVFERYAKGEFWSREETLKYYYENSYLRVKIPNNFYEMSPTDIEKFLENGYGFGEEGVNYYYEQYEESFKFVDKGRL